MKGKRKRKQERRQKAKKGERNQQARSLLYLACM
jgi:hypothetical protein